MLTFEQHLAFSQMYIIPFLIPVLILYLHPAKTKTKKRRMVLHFPYQPSYDVDPSATKKGWMVLHFP